MSAGLKRLTLCLHFPPARCCTLSTPASHQASPALLQNQAASPALGNNRYETNGPVMTNISSPPATDQGHAKGMRTCRTVRSTRSLSCLRQRRSARFARTPVPEHGASRRTRSKPEGGSEHEAATAERSLTSATCGVMQQLCINECLEIGANTSYSTVRTCLNLN